MALEQLARSRIARLSGGERMRVALARLLLVGKPELVILDEPTAGADEALTSDVVDLMKQWISSGSAVLLVAHDPLLLAHADEVLDLSHSPSTD